MYKKIRKEKVISWLTRMKEGAQVFAPVKENGLWAYGEWKGEEIAEKFLNSRLSPKGLFLEPLKSMFAWNSPGGSLSLDAVPPSGSPRILYGLRPCDARAVRILEPVFSGDQPDGFYLGNLARTTLIGLACERTCPGSFCREMGIDPRDSTDCDIFFRRTSGGHAVRTATERGKGLTEGTEFFEGSSPEEWEAARREEEDGEPPLFDLEKVRNRVAERYGEEELWQKVSAKCINCGACTYLCPTCHCFDLSDLQVQNRGVRYRTWDSCAFPGFTRMPVHNPREEKWRRYRQRVAHKFYFYPRNFQLTACVGCGRCVSHCPVNLDIRQVLLEVSR